MPEPPRQRGSIPPPVLASLDNNLHGELDILDALLDALAQNHLDPDLWGKLHGAAVRDNRMAELAFAYESLTQEKRLKPLQAAVAGEFLFHAAEFFGDCFGDDYGAIKFLERTLELVPSHHEAFERLEAKFVETGDHRKLADLYAAMAQQRPRIEQAQLLKQAAQVLSRMASDGERDRVVELLLQVLRLDAGDEDARLLLEQNYTATGRTRDVVRILEQGLGVSDPAPSLEGALHMRTRLVELYAHELGEIERATPHVEALLVLDPNHQLAREVAEKLLEVKGVAARAAAALSEAFATEGNTERVERYLAIELEHTRGSKRRDVLRRLGMIRQDKLGNPAGAFDAIEQALTLDPADEELRIRYVGLAITLGRQLDAARTLTKVATTAKDPPVRAHLTSSMGELYFSGGDKKRARAVFTSAMAMPEAPDNAVLASARALVEIYDAEGDARPIPDLLERLSQVETDPERARVVNERLGELAMAANDLARAAAAWRRVLETSSRPRALAALETIYQQDGTVEDLAFVLEERAKDAPDNEARDLLARAATALTEAKGAKLAERAASVWRRVLDRFGPSREVYARYIPLLEARAAWGELAAALSEDAELSEGAERAALFARAGAIELQRLRNAPGAIDAFARALVSAPNDKTARGTLEKLLAAGDHRVAAASALEPIYRNEESLTGILRVLEVKASLSPVTDERLVALDEATRVAAASQQHRAHALDFAGRGLAEAATTDEPLESWIERVLVLSRDGEVKRKAALFAKALGDRPIDNQSLFLLATHTGDAFAAAGDVQAALAVYRRALAYDSSSADLLGRVDALLRDQGSPMERVQLYSTALARENDPAQRRRLLHAIGALSRHELNDKSTAIQAYRAALNDDREDRDAFTALSELFSELGAWPNLVALLEEALRRAEGRDALVLRVQIAEVAATSDQPSEAAMHCGAILGDALLETSDLDVIERVAEKIGDITLLAAALEKRANLAGEPDDAIAALDRLGTVLREKQGNVAGALDTWKRAGKLAAESNELEAACKLFERVRKISAFDAEATENLASIFETQEKWSALPELYAVLVDSAPDDAARASLLLRLANVLGEKLGDPSGGAEAAARAFGIDPRSTETLAAFEKLAIVAGATIPFARTVDKVLTAIGPDEPLTRELSLAKARVFYKDPARHDDAAAIYRELLEDGRIDAARRQTTATAFQKLLDAAEQTEARKEDRRWLLAWRAARAQTDEEKVLALLACARAEESILDDADRALATHKRVLEIDPENAEASAAVARLTLASGDIDGAIAALVAQRERADGAARRALDLEISTILIERGVELEVATQSLSTLLDEAPDDLDAITLMAKLVRAPSESARAIEALAKARGRVESADVRATILLTLIDEGTASGEPEARRVWFDELVTMQREQGKGDAALLTTLRAVDEFPDALKLWDTAEELARELKTPSGVADAYYIVIGRKLSPEDAIEIGQRAVAFHEEWFDDAARIVGVLERVLSIDPTADWAFDRLKLLFDAHEQWDEMFGLYDRAIAAASATRKIELLDDAAQIAKDFANHSERAIGYLEQLLALKPKNARITASLERLYERHGRHRELIALLTSQLPNLAVKEARETRVRIAQMSLEDLGDAAAALAVVEEVLAPDPRESPTISALGEKTAPMRLQVVGILERILEVAPRGQDTRESMLPPPPSEAAEKPTRDSVIPPRSRAKKIAVRQRAAALLKEHYLQTERDADLAKVLEVELEAIKSVKERIRRHRQIAELYVKLELDASALEHYVALVTLDPDEVEHREALARIGAKVGRYDRVAEVLTSAAEDCTDEAVRVELLMQAAAVHEERLSDAARAIELYLRVLGAADVSNDALLASSRRLDPLLEAANRPRERLNVLERISDLEQDVAPRRRALGASAHLAAELDEHERAIVAWETCLAIDPADAEALDGLVHLLEQGKRWRPLVQALSRRAKAANSAENRRADRVHIAHIYSDELHDSAEAIDAWRAIETEFGPDDESASALAGMLRATERWSELATLLEEAAKRATANESRASLLRQLGDVQREQLGDASAALQNYEAALHADPNEAGALGGVHALLDNHDHRAEAVRVLLATYATTDAWRPALDLTEHRLLAAVDPEAQVRILKEAAGLAETRANDLPAAYSYVCRAFATAPHDLEVETALFRLAETVDGWRAFADVHRATIEKLETALHSDDADAQIPRRYAELLTRLRIHLGSSLEQRLDDPRGALNAYVRAAADSPHDLEATLAAVRVAGPAMRWDAAAKVIVQHAMATGEIDESLFTELESVATAPASWDGITGAFAAAIAERNDLLPHIGRELEARVAEWHRDRRGDPDSAEAAFTRALTHDAANAELLGALAQLQRRAKGRPLVDSLLRLSNATGGDLDLLREAAEIATSSIADRALAKSILERLLKLATERWIGTAPSDPSGVTSGGASGPDSYARWAVDELVRIYNEEGDAEKIVDLLVEASRLPFEVDTTRAMLHQAARVSVDRLGELDRAIGLFKSLFDTDSADHHAARELVGLYASLGRREDLLALRERQISIATEPHDRIALRLEAARLQSELGHGDAAIATLHANLKEEPRHPQTVDALVAVLVAHEQSADLATLLADQAQLAEASQDIPGASNFWAQAATVAEERLGDTDAAMTYFGRVVAIAPNASALDALSRLSLARQDFAGAADYLTQLRECVPDADRPTVTLRLADALVAAGREDLARARLEDAMSSHPKAEDLRTRLATMYREKKDFRALATLLAQGASHASSKEQKLERLREAAELYRGDCNAPELAIPLLEEACAQDPDDRPLRLELADTMGAAGKVTEARALLRGLIDAFGGRRPKERAPVHYHLARLDLRAGDHAQAVSELEAATRIDPANAEILRALAELARDDGQLERAERSYRALLAVVRRVENPAENAPIVRSEALLELSDIAQRQGEKERAEEILESALEAAASHPVEGVRLERALRKRKDFVTLAKAIEAQLARTQEPAQSVAKMIELAEVLATELDRTDDAFAMSLRAVDLAPHLAAAHDGAVALARKTADGSARYVTAVEALISRAEANSDTKLAGALLLRLGTTIATELHDDARAVATFERAENLPGGDAGEVLRSLEQLYERTQNRAGQERVLARLVDFEQHATPRESGKVADALLRLAALRLTSPDGADEACSHIQSAVILVPPNAGRVDPIVERATQLLERAAEADPSKAVLDLYESVARRSGSQTSLLAALRTRAIHGRATGATMREGVTLARELGDSAAAEDILRRYIGVAKENDEERSHAAWALLTLADVLEERGEGGEAVTLRLDAANFSDGAEARKIRFDAAKIAITSAQNLTLAAQIYDTLREEAPDDRAAWEPLIDLYRQLGDRTKLAWLLHEVVDFATDDTERMRFRIERAQLLLAIDPASEEGAAELRSIVEDDPAQEEAASTLAALLESTGREDDLVALLRRLLDAAKDHEDATRIASISARLGKLVERNDASEAIEIYRAALEWNAKSEPLLRALYKQVQKQGDANDRAEVGERLLELERGADAEKLALELATTREEMWDTEGVERVLALGYRGHPASETLRDRLMTIYGERGDWKNLAEVYVLDSSARTDATEKANLLREAAKLYRVELKDPERAAALMKEARTAAPQDPSLFAELVSALTEAGNYQGAAAELTAAATRLADSDPARAPLLAERARLRSLLGDQGGALYDLERAFALDPKSHADALAAQLGVLRELATEEGDEAKAAALVLRLTQLLTQTGREEEARGELAGLLARLPDNRDALASLAELEERSEQWAAAAETYARLAAIAEGSELGKIAIKLANACENAGDLPRARAGLERAHLVDPKDDSVREKLREVYEKSGAARELAEMSLFEARDATDDETRHALLIRGASVLLKHEVDPDVAFAAVTEARAIKPNDVETTGLLADALLAVGRHEEAANELRAILAAHKGKRLRDLSMIHYRLALIERASGDRKAELTWLSSGLDMDGQNGIVATELAETALELGQLDAATKGLRAITMMKAQAPMPRALAYQRLGEIAHQQGDVKKALLLVKRATDEDPHLESAKQLLQHLKG